MKFKFELSFYSNHPHEFATRLWDNPKPLVNWLNALWLANECSYQPMKFLRALEPYL